MRLCERVLQSPRSVQEWEEALQAPEKIPLKPMEIPRGAETDLQSLEELTTEQIDAQRRL